MQVSSRRSPRWRRGWTGRRGWYPDGPAAHPLDATGFDAVLQVNVRAEANLVQAFLPALRDAQPGSAIVGIAPIEGLIGHGRSGLHRVEARRDRPHAGARPALGRRIRADAVCPATSTRRCSHPRSRSQSRTSYLTKIPMQRLGGRTTSRASCGSCSPTRPEYIDRSAVVVDGGSPRRVGRSSTGVSDPERCMLTPGRDWRSRWSTTGERPGGGRAPGRPDSIEERAHGTVADRPPPTPRPRLEVIGAVEPRIATAIADEPPTSAAS